METTGDVPEELLRAVVDYFNPQRVILFGSRQASTGRLAQSRMATR